MVTKNTPKSRSDILPTYQSTISTIKSYNKKSSPKHLTIAMKLYNQHLFQICFSFFMFFNLSTLAQFDSKPNEIEVLRANAENGNADAQFVLGHRYATGEGVMKNAVEAVKWFRKSAEQGNKGAQFNLGYHYAHGVGVEKNEAETIKWYRKAAEQGLAEAQFALYLHCTYGPVAMKTEATKWLNKAAEEGHAQAQSNVASRYFTGDGVVKNDLLAYKWYLLASANGFDEGRAFVAILESRLSAAQRAEGQRLAAEWKATYDKKQSSNINGQLLKRADYSIVLPAGSKLEPDDPGIDADHMTSITLPDDNSLSIVVLDEVASTERVFKTMVADLENTAGGKAENSDFFAMISGEGVVIRGTSNGMKIVMIAGYVRGAKGFLFATGYLEIEKDKSLQLIRDTINSFKER